MVVSVYSLSVLAIRPVRGKTFASSDALPLANETEPGTFTLSEPSLGSET